VEQTLPGPGIRQARRKAISVSPEQLVSAEPLLADSHLPLVVQPALRGVSLTGWAQTHHEFIETRLYQHGAILFRAFGARTVGDFEALVKAVSGQAMRYQERSSPRHEVGERIYTSTDYPSDQSIFPHNEHSYSMTFPLKLFFFCLRPAEHGGETPIADCRKVLARISPGITERFAQKGWMYVRNFGDRFGLRWETVFQTENKTEVEDYCRRNRIEFEWKHDNGLRTWQVRPAIAAHHATGEPVWFNHATFFHVLSLPPQIRDGVLSAFKEEHLPNNTYYGDGSPIAREELEELRDAYLKETIAFRWQQGDILLVDNMLTAHSRAAFSGPRQILVAMAAPFTRQDT
jgi:alpha-ketoglutarate-dependent taurine dioxygenase